MFAGSDSPDTPNDAVIENLKLKATDFVILGSDGLFDNIFDSEIINYIQQSNSVKDIAGSIAQHAKKIANDTNAVSPYAKWVT